jgi:hypothetical protein
VADEAEFEIPEPRTLNPDSPVDRMSLMKAGKEQNIFSSRFSPAFHDHYDWIMHFCLKPALFIFVLGLNIWWDINVRKMVWESGRVSSGFHLSDTALVALITTSMANFLALVAIVAKHLFPDSVKSKKT